MRQCLRAVLLAVLLTSFLTGTSSPAEAGLPCPASTNWDNATGTCR
ncbi:hypothetical protein AB0M43_35470 [Longispora sp. NPDC051575]